MQIDVSSSPAYAAAVCRLDSGESVFVERASMAALSGNVSVTATLGGGGLVRGITRRLLTEQTLVVAKYTAGRGGGWVRAVPPFPGDIAVVDLAQTGPLKAQTGSVLAYAETIEMGTRASGGTPFLIHEGAVAVGLAGVGQVALSTYGGIEHLKLSPGEKLIVGTGHMVAWSADMRMKSGPLGGVLKSVLTGEYWVGEFTGPGHVLIQTRNPAHLRGWILPERVEMHGHA